MNTAEAVLNKLNTNDGVLKVATRLHRLGFDISKGRFFGTAMKMPVVTLITIGRKSGKPRATMLAVPISDNQRLVLVASRCGDDRHPAWYHNLRANPQVRATFQGATRTMVARIASEQERADLWPHVTARYHGYARYQAQTHRQIPLVILKPAELE